MTLGDLIKQYRNKNELSMDDFAKKSGLSKAYISILERNYNPASKKAPIPSLETIKMVSSAINMDFNEVIAALDGKQKISLKNIKDLPFNEKGTPIIQNEHSHPLTPEAEEFLDQVSTLPYEKQAMVLKIAKSLIDELRDKPKEK